MDAHLRDLRYFVGVAEELSFTRAAERLHVSQPALSKQIRGLERTLRAQLFDRAHRLVRLTAAGATLLPVARDLLATWDEGAVAVAEAGAQQQRTLRVGTLTAIGRQLYRRVVEHLGDTQPGWRVELRSFGWGDATAGLAGRDTDAAFVWLPVDDTDVVHEVLVTEPRFVALSSRHRLARCSSLVFADLTGEAFVALPREAGALRDFWLGADAGAGPVAVAAEVTSADETFELVSSGAAVTLLAEGNAVVYARPGVACVPVTDLAPARLAVAWRRDDDRPAVQAFVRACVAAATAGGVVDAP